MKKAYIPDNYEQEQQILSIENGSFRKLKVKKLYFSNWKKLYFLNWRFYKAILTLENPAACNVLASFTRIDASNGRTIATFNGTITNCLNIVEFHDLPTSSHAL